MDAKGNIIIAGFESVMLQHAERELTGLSTDTSPVEGGGRSIIAIVLAASAVEAHIGQWAAIFEDRAQVSTSERQRWRGLGLPDTIKDILSSHAQVAEPGTLPWYPKLCALHKVRTHITHYFPEWAPPGTWPQQLHGLITGRLIQPSGDDSMHWTSRLYTPAVARQLVGYAHEAIEGFNQCIGWVA
jgi:hypothetical protein